MAWLAVDLDGTESVFSEKPGRIDDVWLDKQEMNRIPLENTFYILEKGEVERILKKRLSWEDEAVEIPYTLGDFETEREYFKLKKHVS